MDLRSIDIYRFTTQSCSVWKNRWMLLTSGSLEEMKFNCMTVSWGSMGVMWNKPFVQVVVRPSRHTFEFINTYPDFTLCVFPAKYKKTLQLLGSKSGRSMDKINHSGFTPIKAQKVAAPGFSEAELLIECRKIYWQDFEPDHFLDKKIMPNYPERDFHRVFYGEIVWIEGVEQYTL